VLAPLVMNAAVKRHAMKSFSLVKPVCPGLASLQLEDARQIYCGDVKHPLDVILK
jgi:hypothetical protein